MQQEVKKAVCQHWGRSDQSEGGLGAGRGQHEQPHTGTALAQSGNQRY